MKINNLTKAEWLKLLNQKKAEQLNPEKTWQNDMVSLPSLTEENVSFVTVELYDSYTRDHIHGDNSFVGWVFVVLSDAILCHEVYPNGPYRSFTHFDTLVLQATPEALTEKLYHMVSSELDDEYIDCIKNENDNETIRNILGKLFPTLAS